ncbi:Phage-related baseplate assembly protein [Bosea sp. CRIB-10]|uniref:baseplate J/gp47 family protein n=1 Tax=Bosea sp. CRIB-10 TaxID=378404 RepID=UPI0008E0A2A7|nr:baseplate J/gp47 family protein [Bosea sp. CRIB-10]SFD76237.1 Phage-related baseplate assembly protein [Bosea sp. CRIB-10]
MSRIAEALDPTRLPAFRLVEIDYEAEQIALLAGVKARFEANGVPFDVETLETDPVISLTQEFSFRKMLTLQQIEDAGKRLIIVTSHGAALDHLAATHYADLGLARLALVEDPRPFASHPEDWEADDRFKRRILLAPDARTPGTLGGYEFWALTAAPHLVDARALNHASGLVGPGQILVVLLGGENEAEQVDLARKFLLRRDVKLGTDTVSVRAATRITTRVVADLSIPAGPSPDLVKAEVIRRHDAYAADRRRIGRTVLLSKLNAVLVTDSVAAVTLSSPSAAIDPGPDGVVEFETPILTVTVPGHG